MSNLIQAAGDQLREKVGAALRALIEEGAFPQAELLAFAVEIPADKTHGDFACNAAMVSAKAFKNAPRRIAEAVCAKMDLSGTYFDRCEVAGPGFLNFFEGSKSPSACRKYFFDSLWPDPLVRPFLRALPARWGRR